MLLPKKPAFGPDNFVIEQWAARQSIPTEIPFEYTLNPASWRCVQVVGYTDQYLRDYGFSGFWQMQESVSPVYHNQSLQNAHDLLLWSDEDVLRAKMLEHIDDDEIDEEDKIR